MTSNGTQIAAGAPLYYSVAEGGKIYASESEALAGGQDWDMDPIVYYRLARPCQAIDKLPALDLDKLFDKDVEAEQGAGA